MNDSYEQASTDASTYVAPAVQVLGSIVEMTAGEGGEGPDACNTGYYSASGHRV